MGFGLSSESRPLFKRKQATQVRKDNTKLTRRDRDMIQGVVLGKSNKAIAYTCGLSDNTVKVYMSRLFTKLGVDNRYGLAILGRSLEEAKARTAARYAELFPDQEVLDVPTYEGLRLAEFDVFMAMARSEEFTPQQRVEAVSVLIG